MLREVSPKNGYRFGFSMEFADQAAYTAYNEHPDHVAFVQDRWIPEIADFLEIDYVPLPYGRGERGGTAGIRSAPCRAPLDARQSCTCSKNGASVRHQYEQAAAA